MREGWVTHTVSILRGWEKRHCGGHDLEGEKPLDAGRGHSPGMVALVPRRAHRALRYLHHAGIRLVLSKFGCMPRVRASSRLTAPVETQEGDPWATVASLRVPSRGSGAQRPQTQALLPSPPINVSWAQQIFLFTSCSHITSDHRRML